MITKKAIKVIISFSGLILLVIGQSVFAQNVGGIDGGLSDEMLSNVFLFGVSLLFFISGVYYLTRKPDDRHLHFE